MLNYGKCTNVGLCNKANTRALIILINTKSKCPECDDELYFAAPKEEFSLLQKGLPIVLILCIMAMGGWWTLNSKKPNVSPFQITAAHQEAPIAKQKVPVIVSESPVVTKAIAIHKIEAEVIKTRSRLAVKSNKRKNHSLTVQQLQKTQILAHSSFTKKVHTPDVIAAENPIHTAAVNDVRNESHPMPPPETKLVLADNNSSTLSQASETLLKPKTLHRPDNLQMRLALAKQNYLQPNTDKSSKSISSLHSQSAQPIID